MKNTKFTNGGRYVYFNASHVRAPSEEANGMMVTLLSSSEGLVMFDKNVNGHRADACYNIPEGRAWYVDPSDLFEPQEWDKISDIVNGLPVEKIKQIVELLNK